MSLHGAGLKSVLLTAILPSGADPRLKQLLSSPQKSVNVPVRLRWGGRDAQVYLMVPTGTLAHIRNTLRKSRARLWQSRRPWHQNKLEESVGCHHWHCRQGLCLEIELGRAQH